jgi:hypothetical protein
MGTQHSGYLPLMATVPSAATTRKRKPRTVLLWGVYAPTIQDSSLPIAARRQHVRAIYRKLGVDSRVALTRLLIAPPGFARRN